MLPRCRSKPTSFYNAWRSHRADRYALAQLRGARTVGLSVLDTRVDGTDLSFKILISNEIDDQAGVEILGKIDDVSVLPYDPKTLELSEEQRGAHIILPPFRSSHRALPLLGRLSNLQMVQLLSAGVDEWIG